MNADFPKHFLWGAATAAFQVEGAANADGKGPSIWDTFLANPVNSVHGHTGDVTCDHYHRYHEDVSIMQRLNLRAYRFSVSWSRVLPTGRSRVNSAGIDFYDRLVDTLCAAGIEPLVTLYHWDLPQALQDDFGGWVHDDLPSIFADYAELLFDRLGDRVRYWLTINEPHVIVDAGYFHGVHAPGIKDRALGYRVGHNLLRAHAYAVQRYRLSKRNHGAIGLALNSSYSFPASDMPDDAGAAERAMLNFAGWFGDPPYCGDYPAVLRERLGAMLPEFTAEDSALLRASTDFIALNYYSSDVVRHAAGAGPMEAQVVPQPDTPQTAMGWPIRPDGLSCLLRWLSDRYAGLPIYITENGAAFDDQPNEAGFVDDRDRIAYLRDHLAAMADAMADGVDVRGYFAWSLLDNLEWAEGFSKRFGLVCCDHETRQRTIKASGRWYAEVIRRGRIDALTTGTSK